MDDVSLHIEKWSGGSYRSESVVVQLGEARSIVSNLAQERSATVSVDLSHGTMIVSISHGLYAVTTVFDDGNFFDLIGDSSLAGDAEFIQGGQVMEYPRRLLVGPRAVLDAIGEVARSGEVNVSKGWAVQGVDDW